MYDLLALERKKTTVQKAMESVSSQQLPVNFNKVHFITARRDKDMLKTNLLEIDPSLIKSIAPNK